MTEALRDPTAGILVLTRDNLDSRWLQFEAGAISKAVEGGAGFVCTYLVDIENANVGLPLGMFQSTQASRDDTLRLIQTLNAVGPGTIPVDRLQKLFDSFWPELERSIADALVTAVPAQVRRDEYELLEEILESVRAIARQLPARTDPSRAALLRGEGEEAEQAQADFIAQIHAARERIIRQHAAKKLREAVLEATSKAADEKEEKSDKKETS